MRNFLNLNFKFISRSLVVAAAFFIVGTSVVFGQQAQITSFTSTKSEVLPTESFLLRWASNQTSSCSIEAKLGDSIIDSRIGLPANETNGQDFNNQEEGEYTYTLSCISSLRSGPRTVEQSLQIKVKPAVQVGTRQECLADGHSSEVCTLCENYPESGLCQICLSDPDSQTCQSFVNQCQNGDASDAQQCEFTQERLTRLSTEANDTAAIPPAQEKCSTFGSWGQCMVDAAIYVFDNTILPLFTGFLRLCSAIFELAIWIGIVKFSVLVGTGPDAWIVTIWSTVRDILNIGIIFVLLYSAINVIVGRGGEIKKLIAGVILFGVLTNFSLFLTRAAVDVSNVIALEFYNQMRTEDSIHNVSFNRGLGATVVETTGLVRFYSKEVNGGVSQEIKERSKIQESFMFRFGMIIVFIAVGFMFLQAAFIFIARTVSLVFLLIFSPLMFAGGIFSPIKSWIEKWHKEFLGQIILAPVFFLLLYVALTILGNVTRALDSELTKLNAAGEDYLIPFSIILLTSGLVIFSFSLAVNKAKEYAGSIGGKAAQWGNSLGGWALGGAGRLALGGTGSMLRGTIGKPLKWVGNWAENSNSYLGSGARFLGANKLKDATLDIRNSKLGSKIGGGVSAALGAAGIDVSGVKLGAGSKTTVTTQIGPIKSVQKAFDERQKRADKRALSTVEAKLKSIEEDNPKADETDASVIIEEKDAEGKMVKNKYTREGVPDDKEWAKKVKEANKQRGDKVIKEQNEYLDTLQVRSAWKGLGNRDVTSKDRSQKGKAMFRARKKALEKLEKGQKKAREIEKAKEGLKGYVDALKKYASDAMPPGLIDIGLSTSEIGKLTNVELIDVYETAKGIAERKKATVDADLRREGRGQLEINNAKDSIDAFIRMASKASAKVKSFEKTIKEKENSDEKEERSKDKKKDDSSKDKNK